MPITTIENDPTNLTMTIVADFPVPRRRLWAAYAAPRQLEKFWGPPQWPATFTRHDLYPGGRSRYEMRGPDGQISAGYWEFQEVEEPRRFAVIDGFALENGEPNEALPSRRIEFVFEHTPHGPRRITTTHFNSAEELEQLLGRGMEEGTRTAMGQIDDVLADLHAFAAGRGTETQILSDTQVRITRTIRGSREQVWQAHEDLQLLKRWLLGTEGWQMHVCEVVAEVGDSFRFEWEAFVGE